MYVGIYFLLGSTCTIPRLLQFYILTCPQASMFTIITNFVVLSSYIPLPKSMS